MVSRSACENSILSGMFAQTYYPAFYLGNIIIHIKPLSAYNGTSEKQPGITPWLSLFHLIF